MQLSDLVQAVESVRDTSRKTGKVSLLADLLKRTEGRETELVALYLTGTLPQGRIGIGWRLVQDALTEGPRAGEALDLLDVDRTMEAIDQMRGPGSADRRRTALRELFVRADERERRFLVQLLMGEVRQGALDGLVIEAIARAAGLALPAVREAAMFADSLGRVAVAALARGAEGLTGFSLRLLSPVAPMLASPAADVDEAFERLGEAALEHKLDGARVQVHRAGDEVRVFTRQLQDVTARVPEIVEWAGSLPNPGFVLDGEAIALRPDGRPQPFQVTMKRFGRSKEVAASREERPLSFFFFDCLYAEPAGSLVGRSTGERYEALVRCVPPEHRVPRIVTADRDAASRFLAETLDAGHEGVMAKSLTAPYEAGQRGFHWLKLKLAHTLDLVILAVEWGSGRREGWLSNLHLGARDEEHGGFVMLGKTFKGLTDAMLEWQTERLLALETRREGHVVHVRPELVVEIAFSDVQESRRYPAGLALRFARVKSYREDKSAAEADTLAAVRGIFAHQRR